jgi:DNA-binding transcriptional MerR regulator
MVSSDEVAVQRTGGAPRSRGRQVPVPLPEGNVSSDGPPAADLARAAPLVEEGGRTIEDGLTIEQLAAEVGMSVRNIRNHQSRGLLPAPEVRARVGYYNADHVARLRLILDLQADGFNLAAIERLMSSSGGAAGRLLGLRNAMTTPYATESPEVVTGEELARRFGDVDAKSEERVRKLKLLVPLGDDRFEVPSPALMRAAEEVTALGISLHAALALIERVSRDCESISRAFVRLFLKELWDPFEQAGQPDERWDEMIEATDALRPIASEALLALFKQRMTTEVERAFGKVLEQQAKRSG